MKRRNPTCFDCGRIISWDEATATQERINNRIITVYVCPRCVRQALAMFRNPERGPSKVCYYCGARIYTPYKLVICPRCRRPWREKNPIRHTREGYYWGGRGPFRTREKAAEVARAAYASGYRGRNPKGYGKTLRGAVMRLAGRYRKQGMSHGEALSRAWQSKGQIREYMVANPDKWRPKTNWLLIALIAGGIGYWLWKSRKKEVTT